ncbi:MAG: hypothetical protein FJ146_07380 [Deltaproteobacteria bacterium]|nr:hypothetical protein [Deltaproteobacteria bacterium]
MTRLCLSLVTLIAMSTTQARAGHVGFTPVIMGHQVKCTDETTGTEFANGDVQSRVYYQSATVNDPGSCTSEVQQRTCTAGTFSTWSGTYTNSSCQVSRVRYQASTAADPTNCVSEAQTSTCTAGSCGAFTGSYTVSTCMNTRVRFASSSTTCPTACTSENQSRSCTAGTCAAWSGTYTVTSCTQNTTSQSRTMYAAASTTCPTACAAQSQSRSCTVSSNTTAGTWGAWSGTYAAASCTQNATSQTMNIYQRILIICSSNGTASRSCSVSSNTVAGTWGAWSPNASNYYSDSGCNNRY